MKQELREPMTYHSIISAIAAGASKLNEIATKTGMETSGCSNQLTSLIALGIVRKEVPVTEGTASRKTLYCLADSMYVFWYRFVRPNLSAIMQGVGGQIYESVVKPQLSDFMGQVFEEICRQYFYLPFVYKTLPFPVGKIGRWWGNNPKNKRQEEIDLMAVFESETILGECKWRNEKVDSKVAQVLLERSQLFHYPKKYFYIFSKSGFTEELIRQKEQWGIELIDFEWMCAQSEMYR